MSVTILYRKRFLRSKIVLAAIDFNDHPPAQADEVEDAAVTGHLPAEMIAA